MLNVQSVENFYPNLNLNDTIGTRNKFIQKIVIFKFFLF